MTTIKHGVSSPPFLLTTSLFGVFEGIEGITCPSHHVSKLKFLQLLVKYQLFYILGLVRTSRGQTFYRFLTTLAHWVDNFVLYGTLINITLSVQ